MIDDLAQLAAGVVGAALGGWAYQRGRRARLARADAAARPLEFPGSVLGSARYCHPAGGLLRLDGTALTWLTGRGGLSYPVPVERLVVTELAAVRMAEAFPGGRNVAVVCDDAGTAVRIVVLESDLPYLARAIPSLGALLPTPPD